MSALLLNGTPASPLLPFHSLHFTMTYLRDVIGCRCDLAVTMNQYTTPEVTSQEDEWQLRQ